MTDFKNGTLDFGDIVITKDTTRNDLMAVYGDKLSAISNDRYVRFKRLYTVAGHQFGCGFWFTKAGAIESIEMTPWIDYKSEEWDRTGRQEERRQFCDAWLFKLLGQPQRNIGGAEYIFEKVRISCVTHFDIHQGADAGEIVITYLR